MSGQLGRHRRATAPRVSGVRMAGAGVAGLTAALGLAPLAHAADAAAPKPAPTTTSGTAKGTPDVATTAPKATASAGVTPDYGTQKYRVGVQIDPKAAVKAGSATLGTTLAIHEVAADGTVSDSTCTTDVASTVAGSTASYCSLSLALRRRAEVAHPDVTVSPGDSSIPFYELFQADAGATVTITQKTVNAHLVTDPQTATIKPCGPPGTYGQCAGDGPIGTLTSDVLFDDTGFPPTAGDDSATTKLDHPVDIDVTGNDDPIDAPAGAVAVTSQPAHGTAVVQQPAAQADRAAAPIAGATTIRYTPATGFAGVDHFRYSYSTANGTATATVTITVTAPPPTAVDDSARTPENTAVTVDVRHNDTANYTGGALRLASVTDPAHGSARIQDGKIVYTPTHGFSGTDTFDYRITTPYGAATASVTVTVVAAPVTPPVSPPVTPVGPPAVTGTDSGALVGYGLVSLLAGAAVTAAGRKRRTRGRHAAV